MKGSANSPTVSLTNEDFRSAETWEYAVDGPAGKAQHSLVGPCFGCRLSAFTPFPARSPHGMTGSSTKQLQQRQFHVGRLVAC